MVLVFITLFFYLELEPSSTPEHETFLVVYASADDVSAISRVFFLAAIDASETTGFQTLVVGELLTGDVAGATPVALHAVREEIDDRRREGFFSSFFSFLGLHRNRVNDSGEHGVVYVYARFAR